jgi:hypothetical protein
MNRGSLFSLSAEEGESRVFTTLRGTLNVCERYKREVRERGRFLYLFYQDINHFIRGDGYSLIF